MDFSNTDRAVQPNDPKVTRQRRLKRKNLAESPVRQPSPSEKRLKQKEDSPPLYNIKGILSERKIGKTTEFLIDWEDNPETGEPYEPTWEPYSNVTEVAIYEWESKQAINKYKSQLQHTSSQDSEPIPPRTRSKSNIPGAPGLLRRRSVRNTNEIAGERVGTKNKTREIRDSYENQGSSSSNDLSIVIPLNKEINPNEYTVFRSSQVSNYSSTQADLQASSPLQVPNSLDSQSLLPRRKSAPAFIWDEDIEAGSQYLSGSTSYNPSIPRRASDCEEDSPLSVHAEVSDRARKGIARSHLSPEALITQHTDTVDTVTVANEEEREGGFSNNINQRAPLEKSSIPDSFTIDHSLSSINVNLVQSAPQEPLTPKPQQHLRSQPLRSNRTDRTDSEEPSQLPPVTNISPASENSISYSKQSFDHSLEEKAGPSESQKQLQPQLSLEIPDSYLLSDPFTKSSPAQGVNTQTASQDRASSLPNDNPHSRTLLSDSQRSQSLPSFTNLDSSPEATCQAAQIISQIPSTSSQDLNRENSQSQGSLDHVQADNSEVSEFTTTHLDQYLEGHHHLSKFVSEKHCVIHSRETRTEIPETQPSASEPSTEAALPQVLASIESGAHLQNAELQSQESPLSQGPAGLAWSSGRNSPLHSSYLVEKMSAVGSSASHLAVDLIVEESSTQSLDDSAQARNPDKRAPLLWLVITNSIEHVELCIPATLESSERKDRLVQYVAQTRKFIGRLDTSIYPEPQQAARGAAEYVLDDSIEAEWPIMPMPNIDISLPGHGAFNRQPDSLTQSLFSPVEPISQSGFKRPSDFDALDDDNAIKRQRMTPSRPDSNTVNGNMADLKEIRSLRARCEDYEKSIKRIQPKYQRALDEKARYEHENAQAVKRQSEYEKKLEIHDGAAAKLREENASLKNELAVAQNSLSTSAVPSIAELQKAKDDLRAAQAEIERLKKGQVSVEKRADYATSLYQESSQQAQEMRNQLTNLQSEREGLQKQASAARVEIQKINNDGIIQQQVDTINELKRELAERERMLESLTRQLESYTNGRRTTRGTSVPRSPRMSNMSPRPRVLGSMAPGSNTASRGNSPAPGVFGGDLFQGGDAGRRFGAHLQ
ncbi:hypothetical protein SS1G_01393 [Sclerotinia sclerotiorum 1980 UF-70]|uniref:Chromo domain-containing protein n=1 Tax=Sclerotinia sclerotiorum (strain ATCC 18683 / 1980 / Ss-1) TaxID=665079 RepID=A7E7W5_SCLS1|nr:hypothetical protein SS1G_01393 [Sclerotinia sclerotiorum 1980 UF-70]EDN96467.1 hypothetical protein SS1G_01393 [Sclerotinia sclerotiorum 1980 UF-70]